MAWPSISELDQEDRSMGHMQLSHTRIVPDAWRDLSDADNDAQTAAIYGVIAKHGGDVKVVAFVPNDGTLLSVIEYPDLASAQRSVADILALQTLEFASIQELWDVVEFTQLVRKASTGG
jgi:hypothetical protein